MSTQTYASNAWLLKGMTGSVPGWLELRDGSLRFITPDGEGFDVERAAVTSVVFPWYYFGGGMKIVAESRRYRFSFVKPNGAEYAEARALAAFGDVRALRAAASKIADVRGGRVVGARWRELLREDESTP